MPELSLRQFIEVCNYYLKCLQVGLNHVGVQTQSSNWCSFQRCCKLNGPDGDTRKVSYVVAAC